MKPHIDEAILVEGKFDKERVLSAVDALVIATEGFRIFRNPEKRDMIRTLAEKNGLIILTDSDSAGLLIRNHIKSFIPAEFIKNAYIPPVPGKERRKKAPSKEGVLGVEAMDPEVIREALKRSGAKINGKSINSYPKLTYNDLYRLGLAGRPESSVRRQQLLADNHLPQNLSVKALLELINRGGVDFGYSGIGGNVSGDDPDPIQNEEHSQSH